MRFRRHLLATLPAIATLACSGEEWDVPRPTTVDTTTVGRVVLTAGPFDASVRSYTLRPTARIGGGDSGPSAFGQAVDLHMRADTLFVADAMLETIQAFDLAGNHLGSWGKKGEGPGEFRSLSGMAADGDGLLWAMDEFGLRLTAFPRDGDPYSAPSVKSSLGGGSLSWFGVFRGDSLFDLEFFGRATGTYREPQLVLAHVSEGSLERVDSVSFPEFERPTRPVAARGGGGEMRSPPFWPTRHFTLSPQGTLWINDVAEYELHEIGLSGDTLTTIRVLTSPRPVTKGERNGAARATGWPRGKIPRSHQLLQSIAVGVDGRVWAEIRDEDEEVRTWDVWSLDGTRIRVHSTLGYVQVPPWSPLSNGILGAVRDDLDRQIIVLSEISPLPENSNNW
jgi:hypothetical protein